MSSRWSASEKGALGAADDAPLAARKIRSSTFKLAFKRALLQVAGGSPPRLFLGMKNPSIVEAFANIRKQKQRALLHLQVGEPTRKLLASSMADLAERTGESDRNASEAVGAFQRDHG